MPRGITPIPPKPGQESVWDYPRPPRLEKAQAHLRVEVGGIIIADTNRGYRVLETSHPPVYYISPEDIRMDLLQRVGGKTSFCEFKGMAIYYNYLKDGKGISQIAWAYPDPTKGFEPIKDYLAFYASKVDACFVGDEKVQAQEGDFYGGWITSKVVGPFKGGAGTWGW